MFCSDIIAQDVFNWQEGSTIFIDAPTGSGKTFFILKTLLPMALAMEREILYLSNRKLLHRQLIKQTCEIFGIPFHLMKDEKIAEFSGITFMTYQTLQERLHDNDILNDNPYFYYLVADEVHYFAEDSAFNAQIGRLINWLPKMRKNITIAISATIKYALPYLGFYNGGWQEIKEEQYRTIYWREPRKLFHRLYGEPEYLYFYQIKVKLPPYNIVVYQTSKEIVGEINSDTSGDKWLIFQSSKEQATKKLVGDINKSCIFLTAENKDDDEMQKIIEEQQFSQEVLVTTKVLDNGVSLHDKKIQKIVLDTVSKTEFLQMLGRRRRYGDEQETLTLYIPKKSAKYFAGRINEYIKPALEVMDISPEFLLKKMLRSEEIYQIVRRYYYIQENKLLLNPIAKESLLSEKRFCERMRDMMKEEDDAFVDEQLSWLGQEAADSNVVYLSEKNKEKKMSQLTACLERYGRSAMGQQVQKEFRKEIRNFFRDVLPEQFVSKSRDPGLQKINASLNRLEIPWEIQSISGKKKGEETVWILQRKESRYLAT